jgi:hypothetical protein
MLITKMSGLPYPATKETTPVELVHEESAGGLWVAVVVEDKRIDAPHNH